LPTNRILRALLPVPFLALVAVAITAPAGSVDGVGRMSVTPTRVAAGSTTNLAFTFTADTGALRGQTIVDVARGWSAPQQRNPSGLGYVRLGRGTCAAATRIVRIVDRRILISTSCARGQTYTLGYCPAAAPRLAADGYIFLTQTKPNAAPPVRTTKKKSRKKRQVRRPVLKFRPLAPKKQPVVFVTGGPAHHLIVSATSIATAGVPFTVTVRAVDVYDNTASNYGGTVTLSSIDPQAVLPGSYHYGPNDAGTHGFAGTIMKTPGTQRVSASDDAGHTGQTGPINVYPFPTFR
jgi:hypothetical protein